MANRSWNQPPRWSKFYPLRPGYYLMMGLLWIQGCLTLAGLQLFVIDLPHWYGCSFHSRALPRTAEIVRNYEGWLPPTGVMLLLWTAGFGLLLLSQSLKHPLQESPSEPPLSLPLFLSIVCCSAWLVIGSLFLPSFLHLWSELF